MTSKEAIKRLESFRDYLCAGNPIWDTNEVAEVFDMALKALKAQNADRWIPCSDRLPDEDHWLGGSGKQFSEQVLVTVVNHDDDDVWVDKTHTIDGKWMLELPRYCKIIAWKPLPEPYKGGRA